MALLRKIEHCVNGVQPAWEETFMNWNIICKNVSNYPKIKIEDGQMEPFSRAMGKRRASHQNSEHELEVKPFCCTVVFNQSKFLQNLLRYLFLKGTD